MPWDFHTGNDPRVLEAAVRLDGSYTELHENELPFEYQWGWDSDKRWIHEPLHCFPVQSELVEIRAEHWRKHRAACGNETRMEHPGRMETNWRSTLPYQARPCMECLTTLSKIFTEREQ